MESGFHKAKLIGITYDVKETQNTETGETKEKEFTNFIFLHENGEEIKILFVITDLTKWKEKDVIAFLETLDPKFKTDENYRLKTGAKFEEEGTYPNKAILGKWFELHVDDINKQYPEWTVKREIEKPKTIKTKEEKEEEETDFDPWQ